MFVIKGFSDKATQKLFLGVALNQKERRTFVAMNVQKAAERLFLLDSSDEKALLAASALHYHKLHGSDRCSIDADSRKSKWRITFTRENDEATDVSLVKIDDTH